MNPDNQTFKANENPLTDLLPTQAKEAISPVSEEENKEPTPSDPISKLFQEKAEQDRIALRARDFLTKIKTRNYQDDEDMLQEECYQTEEAIWGLRTTKGNQWNGGVPFKSAKEHASALEKMITKGYSSIAPDGYTEFVEAKANGASREELAKLAGVPTTEPLLTGSSMGYSSQPATLVARSEEDIDEDIAKYEAHLYARNFMNVYKTLRPELGDTAIGIIDRAAQSGEGLGAEDRDAFLSLSPDEQAKVKVLVDMSRKNQEAFFNDMLLSIKNVSIQLGEGVALFVKDAMLPSDTMDKLTREARSRILAGEEPLSEDERNLIKSEAEGFKGNIPTVWGSVPRYGNEGSALDSIARTHALRNYKAELLASRKARDAMRRDELVIRMLSGRKPYTGYSYGEEAIMGVVTTLPYMAVASLPYVGIPIVAMQQFEAVKDRLIMEGENPTTYSDTASAVQFALATSWAMVERLQRLTAFGKPLTSVGYKSLLENTALPMMRRLSTLGKNITKETLAATIAESTEEGIQGGIEKGTISAFKGSEWHKVIEDASRGVSDDFVQSLGTMGIISLVGTGRKLHRARTGQFDAEAVLDFGARQIQVQNIVTDSQRAVSDPSATPKLAARREARGKELMQKVMTIWRGSESRAEARNSIEDMLGLDEDTTRMLCEWLAERDTILDNLGKNRNLLGAELQAAYGTNNILEAVYLHGQSADGNWDLVKKFFTDYYRGKGLNEEEAIKQASRQVELEKDMASKGITFRSPSSVFTDGSLLDPISFLRTFVNPDLALEEVETEIDGQTMKGNAVVIPIKKKDGTTENYRLMTVVKPDEDVDINSDGFITDIVSLKAIMIDENGAPMLKNKKAIPITKYNWQKLSDAQKKEQIDRHGWKVQGGFRFVAPNGKNISVNGLLTLFSEGGEYTAKSRNKDTLHEIAHAVVRFAREAGAIGKEEAEVMRGLFGKAINAGEEWNEEVMADAFRDYLQGKFDFGKIQDEYRGIVKAAFEAIRQFVLNLLRSIGVNIGATDQERRSAVDAVWEGIMSGDFSKLREYSGVRFKDEGGELQEQEREDSGTRFSIPPAEYTDYYEKQRLAVPPEVSRAAAELYPNDSDGQYNYINDWLKNHADELTDGMLTPEEYARKYEEYHKAYIPPEVWRAAAELFPGNPDGQYNYAQEWKARNGEKDVPAGVQKQANTNYPDAADEIRSLPDARFSIGKKAREEAKALILKKRPDLAMKRDTSRSLDDMLLGESDPYVDRDKEEIESIVNQIVDEIGKFNTPKEQKAALHWFIRGTIRLPEDAPKVTEALKYADRAKGKANTDAMSYASPMEMIEALHAFKPKAKPIDPDTVPELSDKQEMGNGVTTYLVQDDRQGQQAMRQIINTHWGEDANPWCLLQGDGHGNLSDGSNGSYDAWHYWNRYNALPKRVAFKDGKLLAFMATDQGAEDFDINDVDWDELYDAYYDEYEKEKLEYEEESGNESDMVFEEWMEEYRWDAIRANAAKHSGENVAEQWWDRQDSAHDGIPLGNMPVPNDSFGRWANFEIRDGKAKQIGGYIKGENGKEGFRQWYANGKLAKAVVNGDYLEWHENGELSKGLVGDLTISFTESGELASVYDNETKNYVNYLEGGKTNIPDSSETIQSLKERAERIFREYTQNSGARLSIGGIYTGSAADYEKPSLHYVGTGEGSQVYGWGLYGSTVRGVAEGYAKADLSRKNAQSVLINGKDAKFASAVEMRVARAFERAYGNVKRTLENLRNGYYDARIKSERGHDPNKKAEAAKDAEFWRQAIEDFEANPEKYRLTEGYLYEQTFFTNRSEGDESHLLMWYEPVSEVNFQRVLDQYAKENNGADLRAETPSGVITLEDFGNKKMFAEALQENADEMKENGEGLYRYLSGVLGSAKAASEFLARADIDGVKYPIDSFGGKTVKDGDKVGWNYVSFRDDNIRVDHKWTDGRQRFSIRTRIYNPDAKVNVVDGRNERDFLNLTTAEIRQYLRDKYMDKEVEIDSDGTPVLFTNSGLKATLKKRDKHKRVLHVLDNLVKNSHYTRFEPNDGQEKHSHLIGQFVYTAAIRLSDGVYGVDLKLDIPKTNSNKTHFKGQTIKTKIADAVLSVRRANGVERTNTNEASADETIRLGDIVSATPIVPQPPPAVNGSAKLSIRSAMPEGYVDTDAEGRTRFSIATYNNGGRKTLVDWLDNAVRFGEITRKDADDIVSETDCICEVATRLANSGKFAHFSNWSEATVELDDDGNPYFGIIRPNGDYAYNIDFSTVCKKRRPLDHILASLVKDGTVTDDNIDVLLSPQNLTRIQEVIKAHGLEVACALCFVDSKRYKIGEVAKKFTTIWNGIIDTYEKGGTKWANAVKRADGKKTFYARAVRLVDSDPASRVRVDAGNLISGGGMDELARSMPKIHNLYRSFGGVSKAKDAHDDVPYNNDILSPFDHSLNPNNKFRTVTADKAYAVGGVRLQSFSDFVPALFFDYAQMFAELAAKKLPLHTYTKEVDYIKIFGLTGAKINMSLVPAGTGVKWLKAAEGKKLGLIPVWGKNRKNVTKGGLTAFYDMSDETFPIGEAFALRDKEGNVGTCMVGISDEHISLCLADPRIDYIIPYHKSSINPIVAKMRGIDKYEDYTLYQHTKGVKKEFFDFYGSLSRTNDPRKTAAEYLAECKARGLKPKFSDSKYHTDFSTHENYYKLLADFRLLDEEGKYSPQTAIKTRYPKNLTQVLREALTHDQADADALDRETEPIKEEVRTEVFKALDASASKGREENERYTLIGRDDVVNASDYAKAFVAASVLQGRDVSVREVSKLLKGLRLPANEAEQVLTDAKSLASSNAAIIKEEIKANDPDLLQSMAKMAMTERFNKAMISAMVGGARAADPVIGEHLERMRQRQLNRALDAAHGYTQAEMRSELYVNLSAALFKVAEYEKSPEEKARLEAAKAKREEERKKAEERGEAFDEADVLQLFDENGNLRDVIDPSEDRKQVPEDVKKLLDAIMAGAQKREERRKKREAEKAQEKKEKESTLPVGETENDSQGDTSEGSPEAVDVNFGEENIDEETFDLLKPVFTSPDHFASFLEEWVFRRLKKKNPALQGAKCFKDPVNLRELQNTAKNILHTLAKDTLGLSHAFVVAERQIDKVLDYKYLSHVHNHIAYVYSRIHENALRINRTKLINDLIKEMNKKVGSKGRFSYTQEEMSRKAFAKTVQWVKWLTSYLTMSDAELKKEKNMLEEYINAYVTPTEDGEWEASNDFTYYEYTTKYSLLMQYGGMKRWLVGDIINASNEILTALDGNIQEFLLRKEMQKERHQKLRTALIEAMEDGYKYVKKTDKKSNVKKILDALDDEMGNIELRLNNLIMFCRDKDKTERAKKAIEDIMVLLSVGSDKYNMSVGKGRREVNTILERCYGGADAGIAHLQEALPEEVERKIFTQGGHTRHTYGNLLQLYGSCIQEDYHDNVITHGRDVQIQDMKDALTPADLMFHKELIQWYKNNRLELSNAVEAITGLPVRSPDANYIPVAVRNIAEGFTPKVSVWNPITASMSKRVRHGLDFDENADILLMIDKAIQDRSQIIGYGEVGISLRDTLAHRDVQDAGKRYAEEGMMKSVIDQVTDVLTQVRPDSGKVSPVVNTLRSYLAVAYLAWNVISGAKQLASIPVWLNVAEVSGRDLLRYLTNVDMQAVDELIATDGYKSRYEIGWTPETRELLRNPNPNAIKKIFQKGMMVSGAFDSLASLWVGQGLYRDLTQKFTKELNEDGTALYTLEEAKARAAAIVWNKVAQTQQTGRREFLNKKQRTNAIASLLYQFMTAPLLQLNYELNALKTVVRTGGEKGKKELATAIVVNHVLVPALMQLIQVAFQAIGMAWSPDDEDEWIEQIRNELIGSMIVGAFSPLLIPSLIIIRLFSEVTGERQRAPQAIPAVGAISHIADASRLVVKAAGLGATELGIADFSDISVDDVLKDLNKVLRNSFAPYKQADNMSKKWAGEPLIGD